MDTQFTFPSSSIQFNVIDTANANNIAQYDCVIAGVNKKNEITCLGQLNPICNGANLQKQLDYLKDAVGSTHLFSLDNEKQTKILFVRTGDNEADYRKAIHQAFLTIKKSNSTIQASIKHIACLNTVETVGKTNFYNEVCGVVSADWKLNQMMLALYDTLYAFSYKTKQPKSMLDIESVSFAYNSTHETLEDSEQSIQHACACAMGISTAKTINNTRANICTPSYLAAIALKLQELDAQRIKTTVLDKEQITAAKLNGLLNVSKGSIEEPKFIILEHIPKPDKKVMVLVGKGITFDGGGYHHKPDSLGMHYDMSGAGSLLGFMYAVLLAKLDVNIVVIIPSCENLTSSSAYKPGDIYTAADGSTIEVTNTDAEGRLLLYDSLVYAKERYGRKISLMVDIATLTGAASHAVGPDFTAFLSNSSFFALLYKEAGWYTGDHCWELPLWQPYFEDHKKGTAADCVNSASGAGTIKAGLFVLNHNNTGAKVNSIHLDIAAKANKNNDEGIALSTGTPVALQFEVTKRMQKLQLV